MTNRLANETSPYLLQHAHNPVDWYPWGEEAFQKARDENKPVFLSIGYSACHWCHVMERESFENEEIASILNRDFVSVKVDREERPDVDSIYMQTVQLMTGHGGWPMSVFLKPDGTPFFGGTYYPPEDRHGMPGFKRVLGHIAHLYRDSRTQIDEAGEEIKNALRNLGAPRTTEAEMTHDDLNRAAQQIANHYDPYHGGFGGAPKFPPSMALDFLAQVSCRTGSDELREIVTNTLRKMASGGIYDQIGGGFHRYSVDARWLVPHFEKMLYDNALLVRLYVRAWQWRKDSLFARVAKETLGFVLREMTSPEGGFYSTLDADSEGVEGKFYVWNRADIIEALGADEGRVFCALYDVTERGNWEGHNILNLPRDPEAVAADLGIPLDRAIDIASRAKSTLYGLRETRFRPARDEKILAGWNGWMLAAFAEAALAFDSEELGGAVRKNADFLIAKMMPGGKLHRSYKDGRVKIDALLEDYAGVAWGLVAAFEATQEIGYLATARKLAEEILARFEDGDNGAFFDTAHDHQKLITRPKDLFDNATPSGSSVAIDVLLRLALYFSEQKFQRVAFRAVRAIAPLARQSPSGFGFFLCDAEWSLARPKEIAITGEGNEPKFKALLRTVAEDFLPHRILVWKPNELPLMGGRPTDKVAAYVCEGYHCLEPTDDPKRLREMLRAPIPEKPTSTPLTT
ncbi:MAG TPA: thioredoxin domain-containing protein [Thermoanaerobaculia bacterium]